MKKTAYEGGIEQPRHSQGPSTAAACALAMNCPASLDLQLEANPANSGGENDGGVGRATRAPVEAVMTDAARLLM